MKINEIKIFIYATIAFTAIFWGGALVVGHHPLLSYPSLRALNLTTTAALFLWIGYFQWGWSKPYLRRLIFRPNLNGSWIGQFRSDWKDRYGNGVPPGPFVLVIRQQFFTLSIRAYTQQLKTTSYVESLMVDGERGTKMLAYLYAEKRHAAGKPGSRQGAADLELMENAEHLVLEGEFWTQNNTKGFIRVRRASRDLHVESFLQATGHWPDGTNWENV